MGRRTKAEDGSLLRKVQSETRNDGRNRDDDEERQARRHWCLFRSESPYREWAGGRKQKMEAYCVKCKAKCEMKDATETTMKNGKPAVTGVCSDRKAHIENGQEDESRRWKPIA